MPELPGPPSDWSDERREAWLQGAATVARLQADQWAIIAKQYHEAADDLDRLVDDEAAEDTDDEDEAPTCPECDAELIDAMGGAVCPDCSYTE